MRFGKRLHDLYHRDESETMTATTGVDIIVTSTIEMMMNLDP